MALFAIPNPTKQIKVNYSLDEVKKAAANVDLVAKGYSPREHDEIINIYKYAKTEFLSLGVEIDISLSEISDNKTQIDIEIKRAIGTFDEWHEVSKAKTHIETLLKSISTLLTSDIDKLIEEKEQKVKLANEKLEAEKEAIKNLPLWRKALGYVMILSLIAIALAIFVAAVS